MVMSTFMLYGSTIANRRDNTALYWENNEYSENKHGKWVFSDFRRTINHSLGRFIPPGDCEERVNGI